MIRSQISYDEKYIAQQVNNVLYIHDVKKNKIVHSVLAQTDIIDFAFSLENSYILAVGIAKKNDETEDIISIIDIDQKKVILKKELGGKTTVRHIWSLCFIGSQKLLIGTRPNNVRSKEYSLKILDKSLNDTKLGYKFPHTGDLPHRDFAKKISYNNICNYLAIQGFFGSIVLDINGELIWDEFEEFNHSNIEIEEFSTYSSIDIQVSPNGSYLAALFEGNSGSTSPKVFIFDLLKNKKIGWCLEGVSSSIKQIKVSQNGNYLLGITKEKNSLIYYNIAKKELFKLTDAYDANFSTITDNKIFQTTSNGIIPLLLE